MQAQTVWRPMPFNPALLATIVPKPPRNLGRAAAGQRAAKKADDERDPYYGERPYMVERIKRLEAGEELVFQCRSVKDRTSNVIQRLQAEGKFTPGVRLKGYATADGEVRCVLVDIIESNREGTKMAKASWKIIERVIAGEAVEIERVKFYNLRSIWKNALKRGAVPSNLKLQMRSVGVGTGRTMLTARVVVPEPNWSDVLGSKQ